MIYDEQYMKRLEAFELKYRSSLQICNPIEFAYRQNILLVEVCEFILEPLMAKRLAEESKFPQKEESKKFIATGEYTPPPTEEKFYIESIYGAGGHENN